MNDVAFKEFEDYLKQFRVQAPRPLISSETQELRLLWRVAVPLFLLITLIAALWASA
jgi:hypothetical protein